MYTGILLLGMSLGLALGTWLLPIAASLGFTLVLPDPHGGAVPDRAPR